MQNSSSHVSLLGSRHFRELYQTLLLLLLGVEGGPVTINLREWDRSVQIRGWLLGPKGGKNKTEQLEK